MYRRSNDPMSKKPSYSPQKKPIYKTNWFWLLILPLIGLIGFIIYPKPIETDSDLNWPQSYDLGGATLRDARMACVAILKGGEHFRSVFLPPAMPTVRTLDDSTIMGSLSRTRYFTSDLKIRLRHTPLGLKMIVSNSTNDSLQSRTVTEAWSRGIIMEVLHRKP